MYPSVLFIGGTGVISSACVAEAISMGYEVSVLNRGRTTLRPVPDGVHVLTADLEDDASMRAAVANGSWDAVADFCSFTPDRLARNIELFDGRTRQYVFISSASAYAKPVPSLPILDSSPLRNPYWQYSRDKIACEELLTSKYRDGFPMTIVRPSHTYDSTKIPVQGWTTIDRMRRGLPVVVHGDGTSVWTLTYNTDFAYMFAGVLANPKAIGEAYTITGDETLTWDGIYTELAHAAGVESPTLVHVSSQMIAQEFPDMGPGLLGDKAHCVIFDCSKVRALRPGFAQRVPFHIGARRIVDFYDSHPDMKVIDDRMNAGFDRLIRAAGIVQ